MIENKIKGKKTPIKDQNINFKHSVLKKITCETIIQRCTIHGLPHIVDNKKSLWIRIFWGFLLFVSLGLYFYFLFLISFKFFINPDISLNFGHRPIRELPFPAVGICSPLISQNFTDSMAIPQWCDIETSLEALNTSRKLKSQDLIKELKESQQKLDDFLFNCTYRTKPIDCSKLFTRVLTEFGYCFTYNMQDHHAIFNEEISKDFDGYKKEEEENIQWTLDGGYNTDSDEVKPRRALKTEEISVNLRIPNSSMKNLCPSFRYVPIFHFNHPNELISFNKPLHMEFHRDIDLAISVKSYRIKSEVKKYPPDVRKCYLDGEKKLKFFKQYTENMCRLECLTNITLNKCKCVKFSMPREDKTRICVNYEEVKCIIEAKRIWMNVNCNCFATCSNFKYLVEYSNKRFRNEIAVEDKATLQFQKYLPVSSVRLMINSHDVEEDVKVCSYDSLNYLIDLAGLTALFTGCSIISILELAFFIVARRRQRGEETTLTESSLDEFVQSSSIEGAKCFHSSESKFVKIFWIFIFFLSYCGLGFYIFEIYSKCNLKPRIAIDIGQTSMLEIPFPAMTVCSPLFAKNVNLYEFLSNPGMNLPVDKMNEIAANLQACSPELAINYANLSLSDGKEIIQTLKSKFSNHYDSFEDCSIQLVGNNCSKMFNYVLTDYGFCYTFNLEGFPTLFNTDVISDDFQCYKRDKLAKNYFMKHPDYNKFIIEENQTLDWTLEKGYLKESHEVLPIRLTERNKVLIELKTFTSNLCPELGEGFSLFLHMPNEILTPFHKPYHLEKGCDLTLSATFHKTDISLISYPLTQRDCYFEGERSLKYFKTYTKAHCEFECLTNFTLDVCGCVKFSMPRENPTPICGINQTSCYVEAKRSWSSRDDSKCDCLHSCTYIEYGVDNKISVPIRELEAYVKKKFADEITRKTVYAIENALADFGGMLGVFFGASLISFIEIFYFCFIALIKKKFNIQVESSGSSNIQKSSDFAKESTIHGVQFIFNYSLHKAIRGFWIITIILTLISGVLYARGNYIKLRVNPATDLKQSQKSIEEIPFPAVTISSPLFAKANLTQKANFLNTFYADRKIIRNLTSESYKYFIANALWRAPNVVHDYISAYNKFVLNVSEYKDHQSKIDFVAFLNRSQLEVEEYFDKCSVRREEIDCKKIIRKILTVEGIRYSFNMQSFHTIFNEEISRRFDSYGRHEKEEDSQWSLDQGFKVQDPTNPIKASVDNEVSFFLKIPEIHSENLLRSYQCYNIHLPNEVLTPFFKFNTLVGYLQKVVSITAESTKADENLRSFKPQNRGCYFENERKLQFFKTYTKSNCELECQTNYTIRACGCVSFFLPHNNSMKVCDSPNEIYCFYKNFTNFPPLSDSKTPCGCLPTCNKIEYQIQEDPYFDKNYGSSNSNVIIKLKLKFVNSKFTEDEIFVSYGFLNFLTDLGGLLGLFLGCSMLSFFELIYYPTKFIVERINKKKNEGNQVIQLIPVKNYQEEEIHIQEEEVQSNQHPVDSESSQISSIKLKTEKIEEKKEEKAEKSLNFANSESTENSKNSKTLEIIDLEQEEEDGNKVRTKIETKKFLNTNESKNVEKSSEKQEETLKKGENSENKKAQKSETKNSFKLNFGLEEIKREKEV